ncbi:MAG: hypothetical protein L6R36_003509 [Xanthoria steineri]|nr:MAG: hypothetical protein L6R36_003509 [Xanthoria steineri]
MARTKNIARTSSTHTTNADCRRGGHISSAKVGMISDVKNLYEGKPDSRGRSTWVDQYPDDLEDAAENAETARYALLIRNKKSYDGRKKLEMDSVIVQSPLLKKALGRVLDGYPGVTTSLDRLTFRTPFKSLVHRWANLVSALEEEQDIEAKAHLDLFHRTMKDELQDDLKARDDYILNRVITWNTCWMIFEPGTIVFTADDKEDRALRLKSGSYISTQCGPAFALDCDYVDWDGEHFGLGGSRKLIHEFAGTKPITKLTAFPLEYHEDLAETRKTLIERGEKFEALSGYRYKHYQGVAVSQGAWGPVKYNVDSRIILDTYAWNRFNPNRQVSLGPLNQTVGHDNYGDDAEDRSDDEYGDASLDALLAHGTHQPGQVRSPSLTKDQLLLCSATLKGYSLKNKKWLTFSISSVGEIKWNNSAFESLVLPSDHKELILALTESQVANKDAFDDVIQGKGRGMIMLLSGPPGVGKTLTAESVAENMRAPLYMMSAGDLGLDSSNVESSLSNVLEMSTKWNAVLLLDEADVFLEQRSAHDLERNKLVSIFLRMLEYYQGILFLTTNRVDNIDPAFQSRIHISMQYSDLSVSSRRHVWCNFLAAGAHGFSGEDLDRLAAYAMNGREIKNVLKTAGLLAGRKKEVLAVDHVESVLAIEKRRFDAKRKFEA